LKQSRLNSVAHFATGVCGACRLPFSVVPYLRTKTAETSRCGVLANSSMARAGAVSGLPSRLSAMHRGMNAGQIVW
jgi:hypothetical protein